MTRSDIFDIVVKNVVTVIPELGEMTLSSTDSLRGLGANSLDRAEIIIMTMESLSLRFSLIELADLKCLGDLVDRFAEKLQIG